MTEGAQPPHPGEKPILQVHNPAFGVRPLVLSLLALGIGTPSEARAQRTERFALSAHAVLGVAGRTDRQRAAEDDFHVFEEFFFGGQLGRSRLRPSPGLGLRLTFVPHRHVSVALDFETSSLRGAQGPTARFHDVGVVVAARLPLALGATGRLVTPYLALPLGFSSMNTDAAGSRRLHDIGIYVGGLGGLELELVPGFGVYLEAGIRHRRAQGDYASFDGGRNVQTVSTLQGVLHLGLRAAR